MEIQVVPLSRGTWRLLQASGPLQEHKAHYIMFNLVIVVIKVKVFVEYVSYLCVWYIRILDLGWLHIANIHSSFSCKSS